MWIVELHIRLLESASVLLSGSVFGDTVLLITEASD